MQTCSEPPAMPLPAIEIPRGDFEGGLHVFGLLLVLLVLFGELVAIRIVRLVPLVRRSDLR